MERYHEYCLSKFEIVKLPVAKADWLGYISSTTGTPAGSLWLCIVTETEAADTTVSRSRQVDSSGEQ
jgi:hypothetical protein